MRPRIPTTHRSPEACRRPGRARGATTLLLAPLLLAPACASPGPHQARSAQEPAYAELWAGGVGYEEFHTGMDSPREVWERSNARVSVPEALLARARSLDGEWKLLVVASTRCSDSMGTLPGMAALVEGVEGLELRVVTREDGLAILEANPAAHGRPATPTVVLLDDAWSPAGVWVERPATLQAWLTANPEGLGHDQLHDRKMRWYDADAGASTAREILELLERAAGARGQRGPVKGEGRV